MLRKIDIKIMVVIICSAALFLYGVVGASRGDEPVKVQEVGNWWDDWTLFIAWVSLLISLGSLWFTVWWTLRWQKNGKKKRWKYNINMRRKKLIDN